MAARPAQHGQGSGLHGCQLQSPQPPHMQGLRIPHPRNDCPTSRGPQRLLHRPQDLRCPGNEQPLKVSTSGCQGRRIGLMRRGHHHQPALRGGLLESNECRQQQSQLAHARPIDQEFNQALGRPATAGEPFIESGKARRNDRRIRSLIPSRTPDCRVPEQCIDTRIAAGPFGIGAHSFPQKSAALPATGNQRRQAADGRASRSTDGLTDELQLAIRAHE